MLEAILSRTVVGVAGDHSPELGAASEFVRTSEQTVAVVGEIAVLEYAEVFVSVSAVDSRSVSETEPVELCDEHFVVVGPVGAVTRYSEIP